MKIVKQIIKKDKKNIYLNSLPPSGKIEFILNIIDSFKGLFCFFCASNEDFQPSLHLSLDFLENECKLLMGRFCSEENVWMHIRSEVGLKKSKDYHVEILYGLCKNKITINGVDNFFFLEKKDMNFQHKNNSILTFGDVNNIQEYSPIVLKNFQIRKMYDGENTNIFNVQKPKVLDIKEFRFFD